MKKAIVIGMAVLFSVLWISLASAEEPGIIWRDRDGSIKSTPLDKYNDSNIPPEVRQQFENWRRTDPSVNTEYQKSQAKKYREDNPIPPRSKVLHHGPQILNEVPGGATNPIDGKFMPRVGPNLYLNPQTGQVIDAY
jgi:hypothetical protein